MKSAGILAVAAMIASTSTVAAQSLQEMQNATVDCMFEVKNADRLHVLASQDGDKAKLKIRKKSGATDETVAEYQACVSKKLRSG